MFEFTVRGTPISAGASGRSRARWRARVAAAAAAVLPADHALIADPIQARVIYFYVDTDLDLDNILKPILDSMNGLVYVDDFQVASIIAAKRDLAGSYVVSDAAPAIVAQLGDARTTDFVFIAVDLATLGTLS